MTFKYNLNRKEYQKIIYKHNSRIDIIWIIIVSFIFLLTMQTELLNNPLIMFVTYIIFIIIIYIMLILINKLCTHILVKINEKKVKYGEYECKITKTKLIDKIDKEEREISFSDIKKIKIYKNMFFIFQKSEPLFFIFAKNLFDNPEQYNELLEQINKKISY